MIRLVAEAAVSILLLWSAIRSGKWYERWASNLVQRRHMQRRITNLRRVLRSSDKRELARIAAGAEVLRLRSILDRINPDWERDEMYRLMFESMGSDPRAQGVITNLHIPSGLL